MTDQPKQPRTSETPEPADTSIIASPMERRRFLRYAGAAALVPAVGGILSACGKAEKAVTPAPKASGTPKPLRKVTLGFIALTDCAPLVMAKELGYFEEYGIDATLVKQASWPATRDNLLTGQIDGAHALFGMPFSVASGIGGSGSKDLKIAMMLNNNGQAITLSKTLVAAGYGDVTKAAEVIKDKNPTLAMTFPGGTHDMWLRYWLRATKVDETKVKIIPIPPPQMVANMEVGTMQGYCVGEPWNAVAVQKGIGFTHITTQDIWENHPEKALVVNAGFAQKTDILEDVMKAVLKACKWLDNIANVAKMAQTISAPGYVNAPALDIQGRIQGKYDLGAGLGTKTFTSDRMRFYRGGETNFPRHGHGVWFLAQYKRLGLLKTEPDYTLPKELILSSLYRKVAADLKIDVPSDDMKPFDVKLDKATFDPTKPALEVARA